MAELPNLAPDDLFDISREPSGSPLSDACTINTTDYKLVAPHFDFMYKFGMINQNERIMQDMDNLKRLQSSLAMVLTYGLANGLYGDSFEPLEPEEIELDPINEALVSGDYWAIDGWRMRTAKLQGLVSSETVGIQPIFRGKSDVIGLAPISFKPSSLMSKIKNK